jgi:hypothetical protein
VRKPVWFFCICFLLYSAASARAFEIRKTALYVFLHEVKPIEEKAAKALEQKDYALALRRYREALQGYERIWKDYPDLPNERPRGIDLMVDESIDTCKKIIEEIKEKGEAADEFLQKLDEPVSIDFADQNIFNVARALTSITDVNIIVDQTVFEKKNDALKSKVSIRTEQPWALRTVIERLCQETGLAYSVEEDHVFLSTRVKLDKQK